MRPLGWAGPPGEAPRAVAGRRRRLLPGRPLIGASPPSPRRSLRAVAASRSAAAAGGRPAAGEEPAAARAPRSVLVGVRARASWRLLLTITRLLPPRRYHCYRLAPARGLRRRVPAAGGAQSGVLAAAACCALPRAPLNRGAPQSPRRASPAPRRAAPRRPSTMRCRRSCPPRARACCSCTATPGSPSPRRRRCCTRCAFCVRVETWLQSPCQGICTLSLHALGTGRGRS